MEYIEFGKIVNTHALKGEIKVYSYTDNEKNILSLKKVYIDNKEYVLQKAIFHKGMFTLKLKGVEDIEEAKKLVGKYIQRCVTDEEKNYDAQNDVYFVKDLEGIEVFEINGEKLGVLTKVLKTGANDVYEVTRINNTKVYIPAIDRNISEINITCKKMLVKNLEGLL